MTIKTEAYTVHRKLLEEKPEQYEEEVRERLLTGLPVKGYEYVEAQRVKQLAVEEFNNVLKEVDIILTPTLSIMPSDFNQREVKINEEKLHIRAAPTRLTGPTNLNGFPSLNVPCDISKNGLPIGMQLIGGPFDEANLYNYGYAFEQEFSLNLNSNLE